MDKKLLAEIEKLQTTLSTCRKELHKEKQKNKDIAKSRDQCKSKNKLLTAQLKSVELEKKNSLPHQSHNN
ncbi:MAG: hypothetical protein LBC68_00255 [Prevotellaceae bacterium]|jgi:hypothetical protein|nr:hypothetical protein [Prevotellaceae bacterium]